MPRTKRSIPVEKKPEEINIDSPGLPMNIESMDAQRLDWNIGYFVEMMNSKKINFDAPVQRGYVWNSKKNSLLIRSILRRIPISNFYFNRVNNVYEGLEGKQRGTAIYNYVNGNYKLHPSTPPIKVNDEMYNIAKKTFSQLPKPLQYRITSYAIDGHWFDDMSMDEKVEFFILTNSGKPVTAAEISRICIKSRDVFLSLAEHPVIGLGISEINKLRCKDEDFLSQLWCLCFCNVKSLLQTEISPILTSREVTEDEKNEILGILDYLLELYKAVAKERQILSKMKKITHILSLAYMAFLARRKGMKQEEYVQKAIKLFTTKGTAATSSPEYNYAVGSGSAKADRLAIRIAEIEKALLSEAI